MAAQHDVPGSATASESLQEACEQYRIELRRFFERRARRRDAAEDLVQLVYLRLLRRRPATLIRDPKKFMYRVAWNVLRTENQRLQREQQRTVTCSAKQLEDLTDQASGLWIQDDSGKELARDQVECVLRQLPRLCQFALLRHYRDGRSYKEIAGELDVTTHAVKKYIVRGLAAFRLSFSGSGPDR